MQPLARMVAVDGTVLGQEEAIRWGKSLAARVEAIVLRHPDADPETIRLTLIALEQPPEQRLLRSLRRGRGFAVIRSRT